MRTTIARTAMMVALILPLTVPAYASLTPLERQPLDQADVTSVYTGPAAAMLEQNYFRAPPRPVAAQPLLPCTVQMVLFDKARLAQACY